MNKRRYFAEKKIIALKKQFKHQIFDGMSLTAEEVYQLVCELDDTLIEVVAMRNELSAKRWNERDDGRALQVEVAKQVEVGNVILLPVAAKSLPACCLQKEGQQ